MRVTGGEHRGRLLKVPKSIRPSQDMVREALFSTLAAIVPEKRFLDLFAGSGAAGLDAWSRGAASVCWVESDPKVLSFLKENVEDICGKAVLGPGGPCRIIRSDAIRFIQAGNTSEQWDIIFADPPYDRDGSKQWLTKALQALECNNILAPDGFLVFEQAADEKCPALTGSLSLFREKRYGGTMLRIFRK